MSDGAQIEPDWDLAEQPAPEREVDQRISWSEVETGDGDFDALWGRPWFCNRSVL